MNMTKEFNLGPRAADPFDGSTTARLRRMGILCADSEKVDTDNMRLFAQIFAGLFFDDLLDFYADWSQLPRIMASFSELAEKRDFRKVFLMLSFQYDMIRKSLPDPVWWLAGHGPALNAFSMEFVERLSTLMDSELEHEEAANE